MRQPSYLVYAPLSYRLWSSNIQPGHPYQELTKYLRITMLTAVWILLTVVSCIHSCKHQSKQDLLASKALHKREVAWALSNGTDPRYHIQRMSVFGGIVLEVCVLDFFMTNTGKCKNCLPNYFVKSHPGNRFQYRRSTAVFIHHQKSGGTTLRKCLRDLLGEPNRLATRSGQRMTGTSFMGSMHTDSVLLWTHLLNKNARNNYQYIEGPNTMGICDTVLNEQPCSYYLLLRDPFDRALSTYFYCKVEKDDLLCASNQMDANKAHIKEWAIHQRSFLFAQLTFDIHYCNMSRLQQQQLPCWYRQRAMMEETDLQERLKFVLSDLVHRFAVIGMLERFQQSLVMFEKVYGLNFTQCAQKKENSMNERLSQSSNSQIVQQISQREQLLLQLRNDPDVQQAMRYDLAIYKKAKEIFLKQRQVMLHDQVT